MPSWKGMAKRHLQNGITPAAGANSEGEAWRTDSCAFRRHFQMYRSVEKYVSWHGKLPHAKRDGIKFLADYPGHSRMPLL